MELQWVGLVQAEPLTELVDRNLRLGKRVGRRAAPDPQSDLDRVGA